MYDIDRHKQQIRDELARRGLGSQMNDTRWRELLVAIDSLPFAPPYQRKDVLFAEAEPRTFSDDVTYLGDWTESLLPWFSIEWLVIRPRYLQRPGRLLPYQAVDCEAELRQALDDLKQPYEYQDGTFRIYGYR